MHEELPQLDSADDVELGGLGVGRLPADADSAGGHSLDAGLRMRRPGES